MEGVRDTPANRDRFGDVTAIVLEQYLATHWGLSLGAAVSIAREGPDVIRLSIPADQAATAHGSVVLYRASDPAADRTFAFTPDAQGCQQIRLNALASGHWIVKFHWSAAGRDYDTEQPVMLR